jgi:hypothetical protein
LPSEVKINAPLRVPTRTRTPLMSLPSLNFVPIFAQISAAKKVALAIFNAIVNPHP